MGKDGQAAQVRSELELVAECNIHGMMDGEMMGTREPEILEIE